MRSFIIGAILLSVSLPANAVAQTNTSTPPTIGATSDADIKAEYLEAMPYRPCPANVRLPNGQQMCVGLPEGSRPYTLPPNR
jgi:hypothetical protein